MHPTAATVVKNHLSVAARRLGVADPVPALGGALERTFHLPVGDLRYGNNALAPGSMPFELSYSEVSPRNLRFDMELCGPHASPEARRHETSRETRRLVHQHFGQAALRWFDERSEAWRTGPVDMGARFGAFFGASFDDNGLNEAKAYYEFRPDQVAALPDNLQHAVRVAMAVLPGLVPIFTSIAAGRQRGAQRVYMFYPGELRLLDLEPLMHRLGIGHQLPSILAALGVITGGRFILPAGSAVLGLRDTPRGIELKLDLLMPAFSDPPENMHGLIQLHLAQRPDSQRSLRDWMQAVTPDDRAGPGDISVIGVKVNPKMPSRIAVYLRPDEARPRRLEPPTRRAPSHFALDPFSAVQG